MIEIKCELPRITWFAAFTTYVGYTNLLIFGHLRDLFGRYFGDIEAPTVSPLGMAPLLLPNDSFYTRRIYHRVQDSFQRPIQSAPGASIDVVLRERSNLDCLMHIKQPIETRRCLNLGSYNYLGFADNWKDSACGAEVVDSLNMYAYFLCTSPCTIQNNHVSVLKVADWCRFEPYRCWDNINA
jgi:serine palmitoyltransferase